MTGPGFIHLHVHSAYSLLEGALQLETILKLAGEDAQPALGIADTGNLFGALEFSEKASKKGIQPLVGVELAKVIATTFLSSEYEPGGRSQPKIDRIEAYERERR